MADENIIFMLTADNVVNVYQIEVIPPNIQFRSDSLKTWMASKSFPKTFKVINFDIFDSKYFVIYYDDNSVEVWLIEMKIYLVYKMKLPLYVYKDYTFGPKMHRGYKNDVLSILF